jgi:hypothetical protein
MERIKDRLQAPEAATRKRRPGKVAGISVHTPHTISPGYALLCSQPLCQLDIRPKPTVFVAAITKGLIGRLATAAQVGGVLPIEVELMPLGVFNNKLPRDAVWTMLLTNNRSLAHACGPLVMLHVFCCLPLTAIKMD